MMEAGPGDLEKTRCRPEGSDRLSHGTRTEQEGSHALSSHVTNVEPDAFCLGPPETMTA